MNYSVQGAKNIRPAQTIGKKNKKNLLITSYLIDFTQKRPINPNKRVKYLSR